MNTAELTALNTETLTEIATNRTLANISRRAATLFQNGYRAEATGFTGLYRVHGPQGQTYMVTCDSVLGFDCDCECFKKLNTCKHLQAVDLAVREGAQADADFERAQEVKTFFDMSADRF